MSKESAALVQKLWGYCNLLRDDGVVYSDYLEQLTYLIFLKMSDENSLSHSGKKSLIPEIYNWASLLSCESKDELEKHYQNTLDALGKQGGMLGVIFHKAYNKIQDPAKLRRLIELIDQEHWGEMTDDVKGDAYEGLLQKNAQESKSGAGQYFTPRPLIQAIVEVIRPQSGETICDPACGTGGFLLEAHRYILKHNKNLNKRKSDHLRLQAIRGFELVHQVTRLCAMNFWLHGIGPTPEEDFELPIQSVDSLRDNIGDSYKVIFSNPPFGKKSSMTVVTNGNGHNGNGEDSAASKNGKQDSLTIVNNEFWASTSNKQLNFVQLISNLEDKNGRAAVIVPDNVLFESGAGETIRRKLLEECDVHTLLRLPTGIFHAQGVKANVLFFDKKKPNGQLWIYDFRTNIRYNFKTNQLKRQDLDEFVTCYHADNRNDRTPTWSQENPNGRWRAYSHEELLRRDKANLDILWLRDESFAGSDRSNSPELIVAEIVESLRVTLARFEAMYADMAKRKEV